MDLRKTTENHHQLEIHPTRIQSVAVAMTNSLHVRVSLKLMIALPHHSMAKDLKNNAANHAVIREIRKKEAQSAMTSTKPVLPSSNQLDATSNSTGNLKSGMFVHAHANEHTINEIDMVSHFI